MIISIPGIVSQAGASDAVSKILTENSWNTIAEVAAAGEARKYWSIGDTKQIHVQGTIGTLNVNENYGVYIIGFDYDGAEGTIDFGTFKTKDGESIALLDDAYSTTSPDGTKYFNLNHEKTTLDTGWWDCEIHEDILSGGSTSFRNALPADLRNVMKSIPCRGAYLDPSGEGYELRTRDVMLKILSEVEIFGKATFCDTVEESFIPQYEYYANGNSCVKYRSNDLSLQCVWHTRSPKKDQKGYSCVWANRVNYYDSTNVSLGLAPVFRV